MKNAEFRENHRGRWAGSLLLAVLIVFSSVGVVCSSFECRKLVAGFEQLQEENNYLQVERGKLLLERSTLGSLNRIELLAKKLGMRVPAPDEVVLISPDEFDRFLVSDSKQRYLLLAGQHQKY